MSPKDFASVEFSHFKAKKGKVSVAKRRRKLRFPLVYFLLCVILYVFCIPIFLASSLRSKHKDSIPQRFFASHLSLLVEPHFWFHACSFGEVRSLEPIINAILMRQSDCVILITTITHTGNAEARRLFSDKYPTRVFVKYLPFEIFLPLWQSKLDKLKSLVVMEAELWKMLFFVAKKSGAKTFLLNARISDRSYKSYQRLREFYAGIFKYIDVVLAQSQKDKKRLQSFKSRNVSVFGNLKMLNPPKPTKNYDKPNKLVVLGASTHKGEEECILRAFLQLQKKEPFSLLILAPRHPERFIEVCKMLQSRDVAFARFSQIDGLDSKNASVIVLDTLGELINMYAISDVVVLGGSFVPKVGGHNPLEPAFFGNRLISGKYIFNQQALFACISGAQLIDLNALSNTLLHYKSLPQSSVHFRKNGLEEILILIG